MSAAEQIPEFRIQGERCSSVMEPSVHGSMVREFFKEFNTEITEYTERTENTEIARLTEEVFGGGTDDAGGGLEAGFVAVSANEHNRRAFGLFHEEAGGGGELIGNGEDRGGERLSVAIAGAAEIEEYGHTRCANGHIGQTQTPGPAEGVTDDDGDAFAGTPTKHSSEFFCGTVRMAWEQSYKIVAGNIGMVDAGIGADETMMGFRYEHVIAADDAPRLIQVHLDGTRIFLQPRGEGTGLRGWSYRR